MNWEKYDISDLSEAEYLQYYSLMTAQKRNRVDKFRSKDDKKRTVAGEMLARKMIASICNISAGSIVFREAPAGKPYAEGLNIHFNISHSENLIVCAVSNRPIGIDVEILRKYNPLVAKRVCSQAEINDIEQSENPNEEFTKIWVKKEAYAKCIGTGLTDETIKAAVCGDIPLYRVENYFIAVFQKP